MTYFLSIIFNNNFRLLYHLLFTILSPNLIVHEPTNESLDVDLLANATLHIIGLLFWLCPLNMSWHFITKLCLFLIGDKPWMIKLLRWNEPTLRALFFLPKGHRTISYGVNYTFDGTINLYKAHLVVNGYNQREDIYFLDTFFLVAKIVAVKAYFLLWHFFQLSSSSNSCQ